MELTRDGCLSKLARTLCKAQTGKACESFHEFLISFETSVGTLHTDICSK